LLVGCGRFGFDAHIVALDGDAALPPGGDGDGDGDALGSLDGGSGDTPSGDGNDDADDGHGDGGRIDAGPSTFGSDGGSDTQVDASTASLSCSGELVCSGFEGDPSESTHRIKNALTALAGASKTTVHSGTLALQATTSLPGDQATAEFDVPATSTGDLYARAWLFAPLGTFIGRIHVLYIGSADNDGGVNVNINGDGKVDLYFPELDVRAASATGIVPQSSWFCLQVHVQLSNTSGNADASVNGTKVVSGNGAQDTIPVGGVTSFMTGVNWTEAGQSTTLLYVDDVALDTSPIPCE
jgi:hypothetical protein